MKITLKLSIIILIGLISLGLEYTYPKWAWINKKTTLEKAPKEWKNIKIGSHRKQIITQLGEPLSSSLKGNVWRKEDWAGTYTLTIFFDKNKLVNSYDMIYYLGDKEYYKRFVLFSESSIE